MISSQHWDEIIPARMKSIQYWDDSGPENSPADGRGPGARRRENRPQRKDPEAENSRPCEKSGRTVVWRRARRERQRCSCISDGASLLNRAMACWTYGSQVFSYQRIESNFYLCASAAENRNSIILSAVRH